MFDWTAKTAIPVPPQQRIIAPRQPSATNRTTFLPLPSAMALARSGEGVAAGADLAARRRDRVAERDHLDQDGPVEPVELLEVDLLLELLERLLHVVVHVAEDDRLAHRDHVVAVEHLVRIGGPDLAIGLERVEGEAE